MKLKFKEYEASGSPMTIINFFCAAFLVLLCQWDCITINKPDGEKEEGGEG